MSFDNQLAYVSLGAIIVIFPVLLFIIYRSKKALLNKILLAIVITMCLVPAWYVIQYIVVFTMAKIIPLNPAVNCIYLNQKNCNLRSECFWIVPITGRRDRGSCSYKH